MTALRLSDAETAQMRVVVNAIGRLLDLGIRRSAMIDPDLLAKIREFGLGGGKCRVTFDAAAGNIVGDMVRPIDGERFEQLVLFEIAVGRSDDVLQAPPEVH